MNMGLNPLSAQAAGELLVAFKFNFARWRATAS